MHNRLIPIAKSALYRWEQELGIDASMTNTIFACPIVAVFAFSFFLALPITRSVTLVMVREENHSVELLTFAAFLLGGGHGLILAWRTKLLGYGLIVKVFYAIFSLGLIFVALEEISWGQWLLGFNTPKILAEVNRQGETNLHNLPLFHELLVVPLLLYGFGGLFGIWISRHKNFTFTWITPPPIMVSWFLIIAVHSVFSILQEFDINFSREIFWLINQLDEVIEMLLGMSAWLFIWLNSRRLSLQAGRLNPRRI